MIGLGLHPDTHDLYLDGNGNLVMAEGGQAVSEHVKQRICFFRREWFLDLLAGLPWLPGSGTFFIFDRPYNAGASEALIKNEILATPGVSSIESFEANVNSRTRELSIEANINVDLSMDTRGRVPSPPSIAEASFFVDFSMDFS